MEEAAAGRASWGFVRLLPVLVLGLWSTLPTADFLEVEMAEKPQIVFLNDNATIFCKRLEMGDASLQLPAVQLSDAGEYRCEVVVTPEKAEGTVQVEVLAHPVSSLFLKQAMVNNNEDKVLLCKSSGFYPENINITWKRWTQKDPQYWEVSDSIITGPTVKNEDGTYNVTSSLMLKPSLEDNVAIYQCEIWHISVTISQKLNFTLTLKESEKITHLEIIVSSIVAILTGLIFLSWWLWRR
ncbi:natural cytotoxicity triggering receptor 3 ligand 1 isoform X2 [Diceros bicornis minor]|uniref:natural cytotoxicity triggering receptor 3 ligand 1 isoform X2 n=1 Tax=Diceros bicornis minor TaxID=77932 RepID=UPI0026EBFC0B|nr:natural cytotoxicity triggering receptor 3 ligand 1 isoform X2 [Diceros bicornis minor]